MEVNCTLFRHNNTMGTRQNGVEEAWALQNAHHIDIIKPRLIKASVSPGTYQVPIYNRKKVGTHPSFQGRVSKHEIVRTWGALRRLF